MSATSPNELAGAILVREIGEGGIETWRVRVWVSSRLITPLKAVQSLRSGILQASERVIRGDLPAHGNGEVETLSFEPHTRVER